VRKSDAKISTLPSLPGLLFIRTLLEIAEGPTWPTMTSMIETASEPKSRGRNIGIVGSAGALVGLALAPVLTTQIAARFGWRWAFFVTGIPGIILGILIWEFVKDQQEESPSRVTTLSLRSRIIYRCFGTAICCSAVWAQRVS
jgi:MFS family permease